MVKNRSMVLRAMVGIALLGLTGRLTWVQVVKADDITAKSEKLRLSTKDQEPIRGSIVDRTGKPLAISVAQYTVVAAPKLMDAEAMDKAASKLAGPLGMKAEDLLATFRKNPDSWWVPLKKGLSWDQGLQIRDMNLLGINLQQEQKRVYPQGMLANHVLGYMNEGKGAEGLEKFYEEQLKGKPGSVIAEFTDKDTPIMDTIKKEVPAQQGEKLVLSLDAALQQYVENVLDEVMKDKSRAPKRMAAIVMDVHTGEILTMAMRPGAKPDDRSTWGNPVDWNRVNNWTLYNIPVGSIFKTITTSAALEEGAISTTQLITDEGFIKVGSDVIKNWDLAVPPKGQMTIYELMQRSSNVGLIKVGQALGPEKFLKYLGAFGMLEKTGIDLPGETGPYGAKDWEEKKPIDWANMYIGQHTEWEPIQMVRAVAAIANGGYLVQPHLVREIRNADDEVVWTPPTEAKRQVISQQTAKEVQDIMVSVIEKAYPNAKPEGYTAGGKSGTAQQYPNGVLSDFMVGSFVGFAPANNPHVAILVTMDSPPPPGFGGQFAGPVFGKIVPQVMQTIGIPANSPAAKGVETAPPKVETGKVPNVQGLPTEEAQKRLKEAGFAAKLKGKGEIVSAQSVKPGTAAKVGSDVELTLVPKDDKTVIVPDFTGLSLKEADVLAEQVGLALKANGVGFIADQSPAVGTKVPRGSSFTVRLAPGVTKPQP